MSRLDLTGRKFGQLTVQRLYFRSRTRTVWVCKCDCGQQLVHVSTTALVRGTRTHCGGMAHIGEDNGGAAARLMAIGSRPQVLIEGSKVGIRNSTYGIAKMQADALNRRARDEAAGRKMHIGLSPSVLAMMEADHARPSVTTRQRLASALPGIRRELYDLIVDLNNAGNADEAGMPRIISHLRLLQEEVRDFRREMAFRKKGECHAV